ncbi:hypothetical protein EGR_06925 [Echinococcus granulosus]|uniref:Uncharacterized protein n=1 Tax=Echinococcus granulosus TaxID=6210 RepID=W6UC52_ECHGR|nr:hypothetical protein EGR_06925 [Echinococcus granulosus]EUB58181.1 hypothetical protein EGR_06925 [Echinococcus granulosus]
MAASQAIDPASTPGTSEQFPTPYLYSLNNGFHQFMHLCHMLVDLNAFTLAAFYDVDSIHQLDVDGFSPMAREKDIHDLFGPFDTAKGRVYKRFHRAFVDFSTPEGLSVAVA